VLIRLTPLREFLLFLVVKRLFQSVTSFGVQMTRGGKKTAKIRAARSTRSGPVIGAAKPTLYVTYK
jgi:hypothetical protein